MYYDFPPHERIEHVGLVVRDNDDGTITTIEGNTSSGDEGSQSNGGGVFRRRRSTALVVGYGRPPYDGAEKPARPEKTFRAKASFGLGDEGPDVKTWQRQLNAVIDADLELTGAFERDTLRATRTFQETHGLEVDGEGGQAQLLRGIVEQADRRLGRDPYDYGGPKGVRRASELTSFKKEAQARIIEELWRSRNGYETDRAGAVRDPGLPRRSRATRPRGGHRGSDHISNDGLERRRRRGRVDRERRRRNDRKGVGMTEHDRKAVGGRRRERTRPGDGRPERSAPLKHWHTHALPRTRTSRHDH